MDLSFALQALCTRYIAEHGGELKGGVYEVPREIDDEVARLKLASLGLAIDELTGEQKKYLCSWDIGT
jgi:adenosylhomocysteinase